MQFKYVQLEGHAATARRNENKQLRSMRLLEHSPDTRSSCVRYVKPRNAKWSTCGACARVSTKPKMLRREGWHDRLCAFWMYVRASLSSKMKVMNSCGDKILPFRQQGFFHES